ncbi:MAG: ShlB/FhaC/HecB family hemolysin secretion/activation protein [Pseudomonadota bacterium]
MTTKKFRYTLISLLLAVSQPLVAAEPVAEPNIDGMTSVAPLRFDISGYTLEGATYLTQAEIDAAVAPFVGKEKDFSDVQRALEAVENAYAQIGLTAVQVLLPEQELERGAIRFRVIESRFGKVTVKDNQFVSEANVLNAIPSVRSGNLPNSKQIARELKLANENPARQMNVVLKAGTKDDEVDANVVVTDSKPTAWGVSLDNTGSPETGRTRLGVSFRHANVLDRDHVANFQYQMSPEQTNRVMVLGGSYKVPLYQRGASVEFFAGYSSVNSVVSGLSNFQGGGTLLSARYNQSLPRFSKFDPRISFGLDWRDFSRIQQNNTTTIFNEVVVMPISVSYMAQGKFAQSDVNLNASLAANIQGMDKGRAGDFARYDTAPGAIQPKPDYKVARYGASYARLLGDDWQIRAVLNGQWSPDVLVQGEQMRLGGMDAVRGFSEGFVGGESGTRWNLEGYTPEVSKNGIRIRGLLFADGGQIRKADGTHSSISGAGIGLRGSLTDRLMLRLDVAQVLNADPVSDPLQRVGDWRTHFGLSASF